MHTRSHSAHVLYWKQMKKKSKTISESWPIELDSDEDMVVQTTEVNGTKAKDVEEPVAVVPNTEDDEEEDDDEMDLANFNAGSKQTAKTKKRKKGIIYISNIPKHMNVTRLREILGEFGKIGRVYLQPEKKLGECQLTCLSLR